MNFILSKNAPCIVLFVLAVLFMVRTGLDVDFLRTELTERPTQIATVARKLILKMNNSIDQKEL